MREETNCHKAGVSAVIGVILMVAIVVAIGATVVIYVTELYQPPVDNTVTYSGWVVYEKNMSVILTDTGNYENWLIALSDTAQGNVTTNQSYLFEIYPANDTVTYMNAIPPQVGQHVSIISTQNDDAWLIVKEVKVI